MLASAVTDRLTVSGLISFGALSARGRSIFTEWVSTGTVMMKMISSTSMTSTSGVMLISLMASSLSSRPLPNAISVASLLGRDMGDLHQRLLVAGERRAGDEVGMQLVRKPVELAQHHFIVAGKRVVTQHGGKRHRQTEGRHDQRFAHRARHLVDAGLAGYTNAYQRVINPPHGAKQPHERRGGAHG